MEKVILNHLTRKTDSFRCYLSLTDCEFETHYFINYGPEDGLRFTDSSKYDEPSGAEGLFCIMINDKLEGYYRANYKNGRPEEEGNMLNGKKDGLVVKRYKKGFVDTVRTYQNGKLNGLFVAWCYNGPKQREGRMLNGVKVGRWNFWDREGNLETVEYSGA
jgi:antitoxin component YwqK of YwqJK toxin-antitoxin module